MVSESKDWQINSLEFYPSMEKAKVNYYYMTRMLEGNDKLWDAEFQKRVLYAQETDEEIIKIEGKWLVNKSTSNPELIEVMEDEE